MARPKKKTQADFRHTWYVVEWMAQAGKRQADLMRDLGWSRGKASLVVTGKQAYMQDYIDELAPYLHVRPYELLMHPDEAMAIRRLRESAARIVADTTQPPEPAQPSEPARRAS